MAEKHSPDRKVRVKGNRVIHTTRGGVYQGNRYESPRGLTTEQAEEQRHGTKVGARQTREAAQRAVEASPRRTRARTDEVTAPRKAKR